MELQSWCYLVRGTGLKTKFEIQYSEDALRVDVTVKSLYHNFSLCCALYGVFGESRQHSTSIVMSEYARGTYVGLIEGTKQFWL
jgi:hypothetical protein